MTGGLQLPDFFREFFAIPRRADASSTRDARFFSRIIFPSPFSLAPFVVRSPSSRITPPPSDRRIAGPRSLPTVYIFQRVDLPPRGPICPGLSGHHNFAHLHACFTLVAADEFSLVLITIASRAESIARSISGLKHLIIESYNYMVNNINCYYLRVKIVELWCKIFLLC